MVTALLCTAGDWQKTGGQQGLWDLPLGPFSLTLHRPGNFAAFALCGPHQSKAQDTRHRETPGDWLLRPSVEHRYHVLRLRLLRNNQRVSLISSSQLCTSSQRPFCSISPTSTLHLQNPTETCLCPHVQETLG